jgi:uncharacterized protein (DUF58 family)
VYISWPSVALASIGVPLAIVSASEAVAWLWIGAVALVIATDVALAPSPRRIAVRRDSPPSVRRLEATDTAVTVANLGSRTARVQVRDAWQPSVGAARNRHTLVVPGGQRRKAVTALRPVRRGDLRAGPVTVRVAGPLRLAGRQLSVKVPATLRVLPEFASR